MSQVFVAILMYLFIGHDCFALINGESIPVSDKVPVVRIEFKNDSHICSGVFLNSYTILTAAHCISDKQHWEGQSFHIGRVLDKNEKEILIVQLKNRPHPDYEAHWFGNYHDVGIIKTTETKGIENFPALFTQDSTISDQVMLYGCGVVRLGSQIRKCHRGLNSWFAVFGQILSFGQSNLTESAGLSASIAKNDSGGPVITSSNQIIGVNWGTFLSSTAKWNLPNINFITDLTNAKNADFIQKNLENR